MKRRTHAIWNAPGEEAVPFKRFSALGRPNGAISGTLLADHRSSSPDDLLRIFYQSKQAASMRNWQPDQYEKIYFFGRIAAMQRLLLYLQYDPNYAFALD